MIHIPIIGVIAALLLGGFAVYKTADEAYNGGGSVLSRSSNRGKGAENSAKDKGKPDKGLNGSEYKQNMKKFSTELKTVSLLEGDAGNEEVSEELGEVAEDEIEGTEEVGDAIEEIETRGKWQTLLVGSDYKNLGQLRSQLVRNRNSIRKITKNMNSTTTQGSTEALEEQLQTMVQERERIKEVIETNESEFSLLGWVVKLFTGYEETSIDEDPEEMELIEEVEEATSSEEPII